MSSWGKVAMKPATTQIALRCQVCSKEEDGRASRRQERRTVRFTKQIEDIGLHLMRWRTASL